MHHKNKKLQKTTIDQWLKKSAARLEGVGIITSKLDSELILAKVLNVNKTYLHAHLDKVIPKKQLFHANNWLNKRLLRMPIAYILKEKEFFGRNFMLSGHTLVPRPESEEIINLYKKIIQPNDCIIDVGTGSGILAISVFLEHKAQYPNSKVKIIASDISNRALDTAKTNAQLLSTDIFFIQSNLLDKIGDEEKAGLNILIANLPYVDRSWIDRKSPNELNFEPPEALYANNGGLEIIFRLLNQIDQLPNLQHIILEADPEQHERIIKKSLDKKFSLKLKVGYSLLLTKDIS